MVTYRLFWVEHDNEREGSGFKGSVHLKQATYQDTRTTTPALAVLGVPRLSVFSLPHSTFQSLKSSKCKTLNFIYFLLHLNGKPYFKSFTNISSFNPHNTEMNIIIIHLFQKWSHSEIT